MSRSQADVRVAARRHDDGSALLLCAALRDLGRRHTGSAPGSLGPDDDGVWKADALSFAAFGERWPGRSRSGRARSGRDAQEEAVYATDSVRVAGKSQVRIVSLSRASRGPAPASSRRTAGTGCRGLAHDERLAEKLDGAVGADGEHLGGDGELRHVRRRPAGGDRRRVQALDTTKWLSSIAATAGSPTNCSWESAFLSPTDVREGRPAVQRQADARERGLAQGRVDEQEPGRVVPQGARAPGRRPSRRSPGSSAWPAARSSAGSAARRRRSSRT